MHGVATANAILVVSFACERLAELGNATAAAIEAGMVRFGEGGEQNAPLGRAVIGGLIVATVATLMFVPAIFSLVHKRRARVVAAPTGGHAPALQLEEAHV